jgi:hypothetical protein
MLLGRRRGKETCRRRCAGLGEWLAPFSSSGLRSVITTLPGGGDRHNDLVAVILSSQPLFHLTLATRDSLLLEVRQAGGTSDQGPGHLTVRGLQQEAKMNREQASREIGRPFEQTDDQRVGWILPCSAVFWGNSKPTRTGERTSPGNHSRNAAYVEVRAAVNASARDAVRSTRIKSSCSWELLNAKSWRPARRGGMDSERTPGARLTSQRVNAAAGRTKLALLTSLRMLIRSPSGGRTRQHGGSDGQQPRTPTPAHR